MKAQKLVAIAQAIDWVNSTQRLNELPSRDWGCDRFEGEWG